MASSFSESTVERAALDWFEAIGFDVATGGDISHEGRRQVRESYSDIVLLSRFEAALRRINPQLTDDAIQVAVRIITRPPEPTLVQNNRWFHTLLTDGIDVENRLSDGEIRGDKAWLVDWRNLRANDFLVVSQLIVKEGNHHRKPDLVVFLNGLPMAVIELKDLADEQADVWKAFHQLQEYKRTIPGLFVYNEVLAVSDGDSTRVGSLTAGADRFAPWRGIDDAGSPGEPSIESLIRGLFTPANLLDYLRNCITFEEDERTGEIIKRIAGYHQFRAVRNARESVKRALKSPHPNPLPQVGEGADSDSPPRQGQGLGDGRGGVIWHTQGSGKSLTMLMLAGALIGDEALANPTIVVVSDRNDLDNQLFDTFANGRALLRQPPEQADSREDLAAKLNRASGGVIFTTLQKFEQREGFVSERSNIVVLADEAHRSQYGFVDRGARWMREALPNATFVGFTGTPIERGDKNTPAVFGDYADVYDIRQAIDDNATVPIYYEMRLVKLLVDQAEAAEAEEQIAALAAADREGQEAPHDVEVASEQVVGSPDRVAKVAQEIVEHFEKRREAIEGKAMVVCMSRQICMDLYDAIRELRPDWHADADDIGFMKVVMTGTAKEGDRVVMYARTKTRREDLAKRFKAADDDLRLVIVCDMWLTGFDCPPMHTMYLDKPLAGHNLMQAIARVNRVFGDKPGGVVVDFLGIAEQLRDAVQTYTQAGGEGSPVAEIQNEAVPLMLRHFEELTSYFHGLDYAKYFDGEPTERVSAVKAAVNFVVETDDKKRRFLDMVAKLSKTFALSVPLAETEPIRDSLAFFQAVRAAIRKRLSNDGIPATDMRGAVRQVIAGTVFSDGVIDLYQAAGLPEQNVGILSDEFLDRLASLPEKNLALETLRKLLNDQVRTREKVNIIQSRNFREALEQALTRYNNRAITTAQVIEELINLARQFQETIQSGQATGLSEEEIAFYDALANNSSAKEAMQDDSLRFIARELANKIREKTTLDWTQREAVRADMRRSVKRLLNKYGYPPDLQKAATELVIQQAELMAENMLSA